MKIFYQLKQSNNKKKNQQGFAILYAVVLASFIMLLTASLFNISSKQLILSSSVNDSGTALFLADGGIECGLYYEFYKDGGITNQANWPYNCFRDNNLGVTPLPTNNPTKYLVKFKNVDGQPGCGEILVTPNVLRCLPTENTLPGTECSPSVQGSTMQPTTEIISRGFNVCSGKTPAFNNPLLIERRMRAWFKS
jgi:hypothetical protein